MADIKSKIHNVKNKAAGEVRDVIGKAADNKRNGSEGKAPVLRLGHQGKSRRHQG